MIVIVYTVQYSETQGKSPLAIIHAYTGADPEVVRWVRTNYPSTSIYWLAS